MIRLLHFVVQPVLVNDQDGALMPGPTIDPKAVTLDGLRELAETWDEKLAELARQIEAGPPTGPV